MTDKAQIGTDSNITSVQSKQDIIDSFDAFMKIFYFFIIALIVASVLLCLIVLYNLGIMSYMERYREMATLKVLGFRNKTIGHLLISQKYEDSCFHKHIKQDKRYSFSVYSRHPIGGNASLILQKHY